MELMVSWLEYIISWILISETNFQWENAKMFPFCFDSVCICDFDFGKSQTKISWIFKLSFFFSLLCAVKRLPIPHFNSWSWLLWEGKGCVIKAIQWKGKRHKTFIDVPNEIACVKFVQAKIREKNENESMFETEQRARAGKREAGRKWGTWI